jgi:hypothetical protein
VLLDALRQISASAMPHNYRRVREGRSVSSVIYTVTRP